jgi:hypothetical protein
MTTFVLLAGLSGGAALAASASPAIASERLAPAAVEAARQALVGEWKLNTELSDDPRAKMREGREGGGGGGGGGGGRGGGGGGGWGGGGGGGGRGGGMGRGGGGGWGGGGGGMGRGRQGGAGGQDPARSMLFSASRITVTNLTPEVTILDPDGGIRRLNADDKSYHDPNGAEVKTRWDESRLVVETKTERGRVKETWSATNEPRRLEVLLEVDRPFGGGTVKIKRVFDAVDPNAPKTETAKPQPQPDPAKPGR